MSVLIVSIPIVIAEQYRIDYDSNGNIIYEEKSDVYREYNELNQLIRTRQNNATGIILQEYTYDPLQERIFLKDEFNSDGTLKSSTYYFDDDYIVLQNSSGTFNKTLIFQENVLVGYEDFDGSKKYVLPDHLGGAHVILDENSAIIEENLFSPFAEPLEGSLENPFSYEAKEYDPLVQDYDFHFRKYLPYIRIYGQADTLIPNVYEPQSLNRYTFERNSPYNRIDPDGHVAWYVAIPLSFVVGYGLGALYEYGKQVRAGGPISGEAIRAAGFETGLAAFLVTTTVTTLGLTGTVAFGTGLALDIALDVPLTADVPEPEQALSCQAEASSYQCMANPQEDQDEDRTPGQQESPSASQSTQQSDSAKAVSNTARQSASGSSSYNRFSSKGGKPKVSKDGTVTLGSGGRSGSFRCYARSCSVSKAYKKPSKYRRSKTSRS
jgi:RHS repeat-associated protein